MQGSFERERQDESGKLSAGKHVKSSQVLGERTPLDDSALEDMFTRLHSMRASVSAETDLLDDWRITVLGGQWLATTQAKDADYVKALPRGKEPEAWAHMYGMGKSARFAIGTYGLSRGSTLAQEYAQKCQYFWNIYKKKGIARYQYTPEDISGYEPSEQFQQLLGELLGSALARGEQLSSLIPKL